MIFSEGSILTCGQGHAMYRLTRAVRDDEALTRAMVEPLAGGGAGFDLLARRAERCPACRRDGWSYSGVTSFVGGIWKICIGGRWHPFSGRAEHRA